MHNEHLADDAPNIYGVLGEFASAEELQGLRGDADEEDAVCGLDAQPFAGLVHQLPIFIHREHA